MKLFFDTETAGLPIRYNAPMTEVDNWPRMIQIGWILYDDTNKIVEQAEMIISPEGMFEIPEAVSKIHGITTQHATEVGFPISMVLNEFYVAIKNADTIVGHNVEFDINIAGAEFIRAGIPNPFEGKKVYDTMKLSTNYCQIPGGKMGWKWPKLNELYYKLFQEDMGHAHTALADIQNTAKCFYQLCSLGVIQDSGGDTSSLVK